MLQLLNELKRNTVVVVKEYRGFLIAVCGRRQVHVHFPHLN